MAGPTGLSGWREWLVTLWYRPTPGPGARLLQPLSWLYGALSAVHRGVYRWGVLSRVSAPRPVIVVGNLVVGGAGKTPTVIALVRWLRSQGRLPGVVSRGHGRTATGLALVTHNSTAAEVGDEPLLIYLRTGAPVAVGADRAAAAMLLCQRQPRVDVIVSDDGLQHHRLNRQIEVLLFDDRGTGNGLLLPAGPLRQALRGAVGSKGVVLYTNGRASTPLAGHLGSRSLSGVLPLAAWWSDPTAPPLPLQHLAGRPLLAAAGLARPEAFFDMLEATGLSIRRQALPDHFDWSRLPWPVAENDVIVTEKDAVKLRPEHMGTTRVWVATLDFEPEPAFFAALTRLLPAC